MRGWSSNREQTPLQQHLRQPQREERGHGWMTLTKLVERSSGQDQRRLAVPWCGRPVVTFLPHPSYDETVAGSGGEE